MTKRISELLNLERAYDDVLDAERQRDDFIPDILHFLDSKSYKAEILKKLRLEVDGSQFQAGDLVSMDVIKGSFFVRPGARPCLEDWVLYQALVNYIGSKADKKLGSNVYSFRFNPKTGGFLTWSEQWKKFEQAFWVNFNREFNYALKADITSYFANISIDKLRTSIIAMLGSSEETDQIVELLIDGLLRPWADKGGNKGFGLPQGIRASSVLANFFLHNVDALLSRNRKIKYLRWADDIRILAKTEIDAKTALRDLIHELRRIGLDLNEKKTQILNQSRVQRELYDPRSKDMDTIQTILNLGNETHIRKVAIPLLHDLFERSFDSSNNFGERHLRFCLNCFVRLRDIYKDDDETISSIGIKMIEKLESMPPSANIFSRFFSVYPRDSFKTKLVKFLKSKNNIYEWQEMWILDSLLRFKSFTQSELDVFRKIAFDKDKKSPTRSKALLLLGKFGGEPGRYELTTKFNEEKDYLVKRAIVVATQALSIAQRNEFYSTTKRTDPEQAPLIDYLKPLRKRIYFDEFIPPPISTVEEQY